MDQPKDKVQLRFIFKTLDLPVGIRLDRDGVWCQALEDEPQKLEGLVDEELFSRICNHPLVHVEFSKIENTYILDTMQMDVFNPLFLHVTQYFSQHESEIHLRGSKEPRVVVSMLREGSGWRLEKSPKQASLDTVLRAFERDLPKIPCKSMESYIAKKISMLLTDSAKKLDEENFEENAFELGEGLYRVLEPLSHRMEAIWWEQLSSPKEEIPDGGYRFRIRGVFHLECQRLAFFILQGLMLERFPEFGLGIQLLSS
ncbi:MAG TPA: hypothetical protein VIY47_07945, partial [Ignavibacteriaceae bacterium]